MDVRKVLLIDDTEIILQLEKTFLTRRAFQISVARNGMDGLAQARASKPHLIVIELSLPDMNGDDLCRQLKMEEPTKSAAILIVTASSGHGCRDRSLLAGCDGFLTKPLDRDSFCRLAEGLLGVLMRAHMRVPAEVPCEVRAIGLKVPSTLLDLSEGGAFVSPSGMLPDVKDLELRFTLPGSQECMTIPSRVCWSDREGIHGRRGAGVKFLRLDAVAAVRLRTFVAVRVKSLEAASGGIFRAGAGTQSSLG